MRADYRGGFSTVQALCFWTRGERRDGTDEGEKDQALACSACVARTWKSLSFAAGQVQ